MRLPSIGLSPGMGVAVADLVVGHAGPRWVVAGCMLFVAITL